MGENRVFAKEYNHKTDKNPMHFFAAANGENGFVSYFDNVFGQKIEKLYILGGGPGSGKSTLLKKIAEMSENKGYITERIHCSSSPFSLDGVIIPDKKIAVIDGTPPHTYSPHAIGAREIYVDLGKAWNSKILFSKKELIEELGAKKRREYKTAYIYLKAAGIIRKEKWNLVLPYVLNEKLQKNVETVFVKTILKKGIFKTNNMGEQSMNIRLQRGVSCEGNVYFTSFSDMADKVFFVDDFRGVGHLYLSKLLDMAKRTNQEITISYTPENEELIDGIYFHKSNVAFTLYKGKDDGQKNETRINCERFVDKQGISNVKGKYNFCQKILILLMKKVYDSIKIAGELHEKIEEEYKVATDFSVTEKISKKILSEIFDYAE